MAFPDSKTDIESETDTKTKRAKPWNVIVLNDPITLMSYVTMVLQKLFGYSKPKAERLMMEVHKKGRSIVWTGERERAELYVQQLHSYHLLAKLESTDR
ncbi:MAG: ATP-dependent Clp protease adapter ClpS [Planctomycetota bacterium]